ncbi:MAG: putative ABC transporter permease [Clostridia bacterium]|nr:putative ABC transporter permease [Clostridia bacterium]
MRTRFLIYGLLGWSLEIIWTGLMSALDGDLRFQARTYLWMFPIYGCGVFLEPLHNRIRSYSWWIRGLIWVAAIWLIEYLTGGLIRLVFGQSPWNYSGQTFWQLQGLIRLDMAPLWFATGLFFEKVHDFLKTAQQKILN